MSQWIEIATVEELATGESKECVAGDRIVALFRIGNENIDEQFHAIDGICPHHGGPLGKGTLDGCIVQCPWHGWQFDVTDGSYQSNETLHQTVFATKVVDGKVLVNIDQRLDTETSSNDEPQKR